MPGQDLSFTIPVDDRMVRRRYTIRSMDDARRTVDVDFVLHGHGPGSALGDGGAPADTVTAVGPRGKIGLRPDVDWHLLVGDDSAIPVTLVLLEAVPAGTTAVAVLEVEDASHEQTSDQPITWLHRLGAPLGDPTLLLTHLRSLELPDGDGAVYLNGERSVMVEARRLLVERGVDPRRHLVEVVLGAQRSERRSRRTHTGRRVRRRTRPPGGEPGGSMRPCAADGLRRVDAVPRVRQRTTRARVAVGVAHRLPVTLPITLASAARLATLGVPVSIH